VRGFDRLVFDRVHKLRDGEVEQRVVSPSLLGSLAIMAQQDLASDRRVIRCANARCRLVFVAVGYQTRHCSRQCAFVAEKRAYRARLRARQGKRRMAAERSRIRAGDKKSRAVAGPTR
jgi:hypothetical protein